MKNHLISAWQIVTYPILGFVLRRYFRVKTNLRFKIEKNVAYLFAPNHPSEFDGFVIPYSIPFKEVKKLLPLRFITTKAYMSMPILGHILALFGCITTKKTRKGTVLERATKLLERGETIFIFPGGGLDKDRKGKPIHKGVAVLAKSIKNAKIIPVHIHYRKKRGEKTKITYHAPVTISQKAKNLQGKADWIYEQASAERILLN